LLSISVAKFAARQPDMLSSSPNEELAESASNTMSSAVKTLSSMSTRMMCESNGKRARSQVSAMVALTRTTA
jgi:hypothetical protein